MLKLRTAAAFLLMMLPLALFAQNGKFAQIKGLYEEIENLEIMDYIDVLVDGPFIESEKDLRLRFRGSNNQRIIDVQASRRAGRVVFKKLKGNVL